VHGHRALSELRLHHLLAFGLIGAGAVVFVFLFFVVAPYGRHTRPGWGPTLPSRLGWTLMESPSVVVFLAIYAAGAHALEPAPLAFCAMWLTHYVHRAFVYPRRLRDPDRPMPATIWGMAIAFNLLNSYLVARWISHLGGWGAGWFADPRFVVGVVVFAAGMALNLHSDAVLFALRRPGETGYKIPFGGGFRFVSTPNYLGELVEWGGYALATWSLAGLAFFAFTFANLVPRAVAHHRWYRQTFPDYPPRRRAVIPWLL